MNKIGQVTYCGLNYGSVLQCYATQKMLSKYDIECILIKRKERGIGRLLCSLGFRLDKWYKYIRYPKYSRQFCRMLKSTSKNDKTNINQKSVQEINEFIKNYINSEELSYHQMKRISREKDYMAFFSGSDQIWSGTWFIKNKMWFLRFAPKNKRVAWMPSFGNGKVEKYNVPTYRKYIKDYAYLSSREASGAEIIENLTDRQAVTLADPVILLSGEEWKDFANKDINKEKYVLLFFLDSPSDTALDMIDKIKAYTSYTQIVFSYEHDCLKNISTEIGGPKEFVSMISNAEFVFTDSFHACMFSIIFNVPYYVFYRNTSYISKQSARIEGLLETYSMKNRLITQSREVTEEDFEIDKDYSEFVLKSKRSDVLKYLEQIIGNYNKEMEDKRK